MEFEIEEKVETEEIGGEVDPKETPKEEDVKEKTEPTEIENLAAELGWQPEGKGKDGETVDAETYIRKGREIQDTMRTHIKDQKRELANLSNSIADLKSHNERVYKAEVTRLKAELKTLGKEKKEAIEEGDAAKVNEIDEQIDGVKEAMKEEKPETPSVSNPIFDEWVEQNPWYKTNPEMAAYADVIAEQHEGAPFNRIADLATKKVKEMFPDRFPKTEKPPPSPVEGATKKTTVAKFTKADLTEGQKTIMKQFVRQGIMTEKQYIEDIAKLAEGAS